MNRFISRFPSLALLTVVALILAGCGGGGAADVPKTADQAVLRVVNAMAENKPVAVWDALPESYQKDVTGLVHSAIAKIDAELYNQSVATGQRVAKLLKDKKQFILAHPMIAQQIPNKAEVEKQWDGIVGVLNTVLNSELATHDKAKTVNIGSFLDKTGSKVMGDITNLAKLVPGGGEGAGKENEVTEMIKKAKATKATMVKEEGDKATVKMETPGEEPANVEFVRVEGKWIPADMAKEWKGMIEEAKKEIANMKDEDMKQAKEMAIPMLGMVGGLLGTLENAKTQEEFNAAVNGLMQMMSGGGN